MLQNNNKIEIFKDCNMNNNYVKIGSYYKFNNNYSIKKIDIVMQQKCKSYISFRKFRTSYIYGNATFNKLELNLGRGLFNVLIQFEKICSDVYNDEKIDDDYRTHKFYLLSDNEFDQCLSDRDIIKKNNDLSDTENYVNNDLENIVDDESENNFKNDSENESNNYVNSDLENIVDDESENESNNYVNSESNNNLKKYIINDIISDADASSSDEDESSEIKYDVKYFDISLIENKTNIPILLIPCKKCIIEEIEEHYFSCIECLKYNNNCIDISRKSIDNMKYKILNEPSDLLDNIMEAYVNMEDYTDKNNIIYYVNTKKAIHYKCYFLIKN